MCDISFVKLAIVFRVVVNWCNVGRERDGAALNECWEKEILDIFWSWLNYGLQISSKLSELSQVLRSQNFVGMGKIWRIIPS